MNPEAKGAEGARRARDWMWWLVGTAGPFAGLAGIVLLFGFLRPQSFLSAYNWQLIAIQTVIVGTAALGMALIVFSGGIDLSIGAIVALTAVSTALVIRDFHAPLPLALVVGILIGGVCGFVNGLSIALLRIAPFIVTLGTMNIYRGLALRLADNTKVYAYDPARDEVAPAWLARLLQISVRNPVWERFLEQLAPGVWILVGVSVIAAIVLRFTVFGRYVFALGSNERAAWLSGVRVRTVKVMIYTLGGLFAGLAGVLQFANNSAAGNPDSGVGLELQAIAAVVIGGGSLNGGEGTIRGTLIGALIMTVLVNGSIHAKIPTEVQGIVSGVIIIAAVALDRFRHRRRSQ